MLQRTPGVSCAPGSIGVGEKREAHQERAAAAAAAAAAGGWATWERVAGAVGVPAIGREEPCVVPFLQTKRVGGQFTVPCSRLRQHTSHALKSLQFCKSYASMLGDRIGALGIAVTWTMMKVTFGL